MSTPRPLAQPVPIGPRNFIAPLAEKRMAELRDVRKMTALNTFKVGAFPILYFTQVPNGYTCSCHAKTANTLTAKMPLTTELDPTEGSFNFISPLFGGNKGFVNGDDLLLDDDEDSSQPDITSQLFAKGTDCGICYRTGFVPAYSLLGHVRQVYASHVVSDSSYYTLQQNPTPDRFLKSQPGGFVEFEVPIPMYFESVQYRVFDNTRVLEDNLYYIDFGEHKLLDIKTLRLHQGRTLKVRVEASEFTHLVLSFDFGQASNANFPQLSVSRDYHQFYALQSIQIEVPSTVAEAKIQDLIVCPSLGQVFEIIDVNTQKDLNVLIQTQLTCRRVNAIETKYLINDLISLL